MVFMDMNQTIKLSYNCYWDTITETLICNNQNESLPLNMTKLLKILIDNYDRPISSVDIFFSIWEDYDKEYNAKNVRNLISALRQKIPVITINNYYGGRYVLKKYRDITPNISDYFIEILDQAKNGITISDPNLPDNPIIFVNEAFTELFGYLPEEIIGRNCRLLYGEDRDQNALEKIRTAIKENKDVTVTVRNYTKEGELIYNEVSISPIFDRKTEKIKYFLGVQKNVTEMHTIIQQIKNIVY